MQARVCFECGKPAEPPFIILRFRLPEELWQFAEERGLPIERESVLCRECRDRLDEERELVKEWDEGIRSGTVCFLCSEKLDPPGGTTVWSYDRKKLFRLCPKCKELVEKDRRARGQD